MALVNGQSDTSRNVAFYAANHMLGKAALFLSIGVLATRGVRFSGVSGVLAAVLALSLAGLPLTGGALAKLATEAQFSIGSVTILSTLTSIGTAMTHFLNRLAVPPSGAAQECPAGLVRFWPAVVLGAILLPWLFYPVVGDVSDALKLGKILDRLWPVAIGVGLGLGLRRSGGLCPACRPAIASCLARPRSTAS
jgi:formate hydrogenlyase subunit 3/multisubunit Na+/H+ antiporter MnhD subunit